MSTENMSESCIITFLLPILSKNNSLLFLGNDIPIALGGAIFPP